MMIVDTKENMIKNIIKFAIPCVLMRIVQNLYPLLDTFIVGKVLDLNSLSAVGVAGSLYSLFNDTLLGLVSGFSIVVGQKFGKDTKKGVAEAFYTSLVASVIVCIAVSGIGILFSEKFLLLLDTPKNLLDCANDYIVTLLFGFVANMLYNFISQMLCAIGNSKMPFLLLIVSSVIHLILLYPLTSYFGVRGTAYTTIISYIVTVVFGAVYIHKKVNVFRFPIREFRLKYAVLKECFHMGMPMSLTNLVVQLGILILNFVSNNIGTEYIAAYSCASKIGYIMTSPLFGFATALAVFTSQNFGAGNFKNIKIGINKTMLFVHLLNACILVITLMIANPLLGYILDENDIAVKAGFTYLLIRGLSMFVLTPAAIYKSVLPAIGNPFFSTFSGFLEIGVRFVFPLLFSKALGFNVIPLTDTFTWIILAVLLTAAYYYEFKKVQKQI